jgi:TolB-like protein/Flp pilus assembly protein TadD
MTSPGYQRFFAELKRRRVFRVMAVYGIVAFAIIEAADAIFPRMALPDWTVTLVVWLALLGFPVAIVLTWALEMTPEGMRRTTEAAPGELTEIIAAPASKRWSAGVLALVGVTAQLAGAWYVGRQSAPAPAADPAEGPASASIAVLPFADMSPDRDQEYFSDGISEELLNLLSKIPELQVAARTSSFSFKDQNLAIPEIARLLNVAHVLEGSVRKAGSEVRITAQLIRADDGYHVWSETWDRTLDNIFEIQDEIAAEVVAQLKVTLLGEPPTVEETDPEAYALYLQARQLGRRGSVESVEQSIALYEQALEIEPDYAAAWAGLARNYTFQVSFVLGPIDEGIRLAREAANRALAIDPEYAQAYAELGQIAAVYDGDLATAAQHLERALALEPTNPDIIGAAAGLVRKLGRLDEAIALREYAVARDPVNPTGHFGLGWYYVENGRPDEAVASFRTLLSLSPGRIGTQESIGTALLYMGEPEAALSAMQQESEEGFRLIGLARAYHALGQASESDVALAKLIEIEENEPGWAYNIAYVLAYRGEADRAFEWLDTAVEYNDSGLSLIPGSIQFANLHDDPRWLPFLESIGKSPEQLAAIEFEVQLPQ